MTIDTRSRGAAAASGRPAGIAPSAPVAPAASRGPKTRRGIESLLLVMSLVIAVGAYALVGIGTEGKVPANVALYGGWLTALTVVLHAVVRWKAKYADPVIVPIAVMLNGIGIAMIYRLDIAKGNTGFDQVALRQLVWMTLGVLFAVVILFVLRDHRVLRRFTFTSGLAGLVLLLLPLVPGLGADINGAKIWIQLGPMSFQPGEIAKILLAIFFAGYLVSYRDTLSLAGPKFLGLQLPRPRDMGPILIAWLASVGVLVFQRDLGTSLLFFGLFVAMLYVATERKSWIFIGLILFAGGAFLASRVFNHVEQRIDGWLHALDPAVYQQQFGGSFQLVQGLFGLANGGLTGTGLGLGRPDLIPFANSDFIIDALGEELGLVGLFAILALYLIFVERGLRIALGVRDGFGKLLAAGIAFSIGLQCFIVVGGVTRLIPLTGLTTPFLAAGGSSLLANWIIVALLLRISDNARRPAAEFKTGVLRVVPDELRRTEPEAPDEETYDIEYADDAEYPSEGSGYDDADDAGLGAAYDDAPATDDAPTTGAEPETEAIPAPPAHPPRTWPGGDTTPGDGRAGA